MASSSEPPSFATALANVRRLTSSTLLHQSKPAQLLVAIESTISSTLGKSELPHSSTAYFASLQQVLEKAVNDEVPAGTGDDEEMMAESENMGSGALLPAILYLLAIVIPETPNQVVISKSTNILENILPLFDTSLEHPPALRSLVQITTSLLLVAPPALLNSSPLLKKGWNYLLELNLDPRPKVRHLAQEGIRKILVTPIPPRLTPGSHPYLPRAREWTVSILQEEVKSFGSSTTKKARFADGEDQEGKRAIWVIQGLRGWVPVWGDEQLSSLCGLLLSLPSLPHLTPQIYSLLAHLLSPPPADAAGPVPSVLTNLPTILDSLLTSPPGLSETPTYLSAITSALIKMSVQDPLSLSTYLPKAFNLIFHNILLSSNTPPSVCTAAAEAVGSQGILRYCISDEAILATLTYTRQGSHLPGARKKSKTPFLHRLITSLTESMNTHALKLPYLFSILTALISRLRLRVLPTTKEGGGVAKIDENGRGHTAAQELIMELIKEVGDLRHQKGFDDKDGVDRVIGMAIEVIGVKVVLDKLPLNIEPDTSGSPSYPGRAYLLPLIRERTTNDELSFFTHYFRPLSERLFEKKVSAEDAGREGEAKVWETLVSQIWDCWSGFCEMPRELREGLDTPFLSLLTSLLYTQPTLLPSLLRGLSQLISSTQRLLNSTTPFEELKKQFGLDQSSAQQNMEFLKTLAKDMVSVLLNVFSKLPRESRGMVGEVIGSWVGIMTEKDIIETYNTVTTHLSTNLHTTQPPSAGASPISHTMLDLLIIFVPHLPPAQSQALFNAASQGTMLEHKDATVQKKAYRLLKRLLEAGKLDKTRNIEEFVKKLSEAGGGVGPGAQRDRLQLLSALVESLPKDSLHIIPELLSEAVLGTKEVNERARDAGFDLLVIMGKKMASGGKVKLQIEDEEEESMGRPDTVQANAEEYITMVAAGLTGTTPHMISASINALSRLLFEFKDDISETTLSELISTLSVFLQSKNREIVKSALGFAKVSIVALPLEVLRPHLGSLVPSLLGWVHDHKNHFKSKTVHIFERLIRRFGFDEVYNCSTELPEERKVLVGIRKRKERAKKRKNGREEGDEQGEKPRQSSGNAFDDILYNSDSDLSDDDNDDNEDEGRPTQKGRKGQQQQQQQNKRGNKGSERDNRYIRNEGDEPMDLLSRGIAGGITSSDPSSQKARRKPGQDASHFQTDKSGKMVIREDASSDEDNAGPSTSRAMGGNGFMSKNEVDGYTRDSRGNMKFTRNTKKAREQDRELDMMIDQEGDKKLENTKKLEERRKKRKAMGLGEEFKAKRAGGDIKRTGGPDPYSYVSLGQAGSRKQKGGQKLNLTNKKKGSRH
ncbi:hypothetical protein V866_003236 [Kwoniella sp. B9012]